MTAAVDIDVPELPVADEQLHQRQIEVLDLAADGLPNHVIARRLGIAPDTVAHRMKKAAKVLGTGNRTLMVARCYQTGVFVPRPDGRSRPVLAPEMVALLVPAVRGESYDEIGRAVGATGRAVNFRMTALRCLVGAVNGVHLVRRAVDLGLVTPDLELAEPAPEPAAERSVPVPLERSERPVSPLSLPQERVLRMLAFGLEPDAIATRLKVGPGAVRETARAAMVALGARTLPHAVLLACQAGILPGGGRG